MPTLVKLHTGSLLPVAGYSSSCGLVAAVVEVLGKPWCETPPKFFSDGCHLFLAYEAPAATSPQSRCIKVGPSLKSTP